MTQTPQRMTRAEEGAPQLSAGGPAAAAMAAAQPHAARRGAAHGTVASKMLAQDQVFSLLALALWGITSLKSFLASSLLAHHNLQSLAGFAAISGVGLAWPALGPLSYARWRVPALAALRTFLLALPYNFEEGIWDEVFPGDTNDQPLAWLFSLSHLAVGTGLVLLVLTSLGWRLPLRVHMPLQAALVALWVHFGSGPHCRNRLMRSPEVAPVVSLVYGAGELATAVLVPIAARNPGGPRTQAAAFLLFMWLLVGWLLPTLLLLHPIRQVAPAPAPQPRRHVSSRPKRWLAATGAALVWLEGWVLAGLHSLLLSQPPTAGAGEQQRRRQRWHGGPSQADAAVPLLVRWLTLLLLMWLPCRTVASLYSGEGAPLMLSSP